VKYRSLGRTGLEVSEIGFGAWGVGGKWGPRNDREALVALARALELGINFMDTALAYGNGHSEKLIAKAAGKSTKQVIIATKIPPKNQEWPARHDVPLRDVFPRDWMIRCTERSLKHLAVDCIDLQQLHVWSPLWIKESEWYETFQELRTQGKIRFTGVSINDHEPDTALDLICSGWVDALQVIFNIFDQSPLQSLFPLAKQHDIGILARCPFDEGGLTGRLCPDSVFTPDDWRQEYFRGERLRETVERAERLRFLIRDEIQTVAHAALKFCLSYAPVSTVIPGMRRTKHVEENCRVSDGKTLSPDELDRLMAHQWPRNFYN
jgi:aryl-alcohol dehydrogenase-like predicted oxidoreductase